MSDFKVVAVRTDGIHYDSTFGGWHSEPAAFKAFNDVKGDKRTLFVVLFDGERSQHSSDCVWTERTRYVATE